VTGFDTYRTGLLCWGRTPVAEAVAMLVRIRHPERLIYPESDGKPMGENTLQFQWIVTLFHGLENLFFDDPNVFVAGDLFWYPVKGDPTTVMAPDIMVVFGRPKGHRQSYKQWEERKVAPQVVVEVHSPSNTRKDLREKRQFYSRYGVEELYQYDPETGEFEVRVRGRTRLGKARRGDGFVSPRLGVRFEVLADKSLRVIRPDGRPFLTYQELITAAEVQQKRADKLAAKLRALGIDPDTV
jgi:Uma2 family endonuclease